MRRETVFLTLPGLNFGLKSAVVSFNRFPLVAVRLLRELFGWTGGSYFDDFVTVEPSVPPHPWQTLTDTSRH